MFSLQTRRLQENLLLSAAALKEFVAMWGLGTSAEYQEEFTSVCTVGGLD